MTLPRSWEHLGSSEATNLTAVWMFSEEGIDRRYVDRCSRVPAHDVIPLRCPFSAHTFHEGPRPLANYILLRRKAHLTKAKGCSACGYGVAETGPSNAQRRE